MNFHLNSNCEIASMIYNILNIHMGIYIYQSLLQKNGYQLLVYDLQNWLSVHIYYRASISPDLQFQMSVYTYRASYQSIFSGPVISLLLLLLLLLLYLPPA